MPHTVLSPYDAREDSQGHGVERSTDDGASPVDGVSSCGEKSMFRVSSSRGCVDGSSEGKTMNTIDSILEFNKEFVEQGCYRAFSTDKYPDKKLAIVSCMDTRLTELLPAALGLKNGDAKLIKNAGGVISHPFGSVMRSILVAVFELGVETIMVIGHSNCGAQHMNAESMIEHMIDAGVPEDHIEMMRYCGVDFETWLSGFGDGEESVRATVDTIAHHPLIPDFVEVAGFIIDSQTGELFEVAAEG